jgi:hypothetical protein
MRLRRGGAASPEENLNRATLCEGIRERQSCEHFKRSVAFKINRNPDGLDEGLKEAR